MKKFLIPIIGLLVVLGLAGWWLGYFSDTPDEVDIDDAVSQVADPDSSVDSDDTTATSASADAPAAAGIDGTWQVQPNDAVTFVGYRINEVLTTIGDFEVVGRTSDVTGSVVAAGTTISAVDITVQMATLTTDNTSRDGAMRGQALETDQFPEATFSLTSPIELGSVPNEGETVSVTASGDLTIHGVTQPVDFPLEAQLTGGNMVVVGQLNMLLADYNINAPSAPIVASVEDNALLELSLVLAR